MPISFFSTGSKGSTSRLAASVFRSDDMQELSLSSERRLETREEKQGNQQSHPDHEAEQAYDINRREFSKTVLPESSEIGEHADREKGQDEEDDAEHVGLTGRGRQRLCDLGRRAGRKPQGDRKHQHKAENELGEALPDLRRLRLVGALVDVIGPD